MRVAHEDRKRPGTRILCWIVDEKKGYATGDEIMKITSLTNTTGGWAALISSLRSIARQGWVILREGPDRGAKFTEVEVTPAGHLWRDYLKWEPIRRKLNWLDGHRYIRALELALDPLAKVGVFLRDNPGRRADAEYFLRSLGITPIQAELAAEIRYPVNPDKVIYPWTPLSPDDKHFQLGYKSDGTRRYSEKRRRVKAGDLGDGDVSHPAPETDRSDIPRGEPGGGSP